MSLNAREKTVIATKAMNLSEKESLDYLKEKGYEMSKRTYYRILEQTSSETKKRLYDIAKNQGQNMLDRIDTFKALEKSLWDDHDKCDDILLRLKISREIRDLQQYISAYNKATAGVIEDVVENFEKDYEYQVPDLSSLAGTETQKETSLNS